MGDWRLAEIIIKTRDSIICPSRFLNPEPIPRTSVSFLVPLHIPRIKISSVFSRMHQLHPMSPSLRMYVFRSCFRFTFFWLMYGFHPILPSVRPAAAKYYKRRNTIHSQPQLPTGNQFLEAVTLVV